MAASCLHCLISTMAASVISTLPAGFSCSTIELKVNFIRPVTVETGVLKCEARPVHTGKKLATAEGKVRDENGNITCPWGLYLLYLPCCMKQWKRAG